MANRTAEIIVCGAGVAGISAAYHLARAGIRDILILDPRPPLSLTSDMSTEAYRNWWPDPAMTSLMNRSIDLLEELRHASGNAFRMNRRGYVYFTTDPNNVEPFRERAARVAELGGGALRVHRTRAAGYSAAEPLVPAAGADLLLDPDLIHDHFPYVTPKAVAALHVRRAGWLSAHELGMYLLEEARGLGVRLEACAIASVKQAGGHFKGVVLSSGEEIDAASFVLAAGPHLRDVGGLMGITIPVHTELHLKVTFRDRLGALDRSAPLLILDDVQYLPWEDEERAALAAEYETRWLTEPFPGGVHARPEGVAESQNVLMLWDYVARTMDPVFPPPYDDAYPEVVLRGLATLLPGLRQYFGRTPRPVMDGGYYVKTEENRLLAGPLPVSGTYVLGALSGYGIMSCMAAGELLAAHVTSSPLPAYAPAFSIERYGDPTYRASLVALDASGQL